MSSLANPGANCPLFWRRLSLARVSGRLSCACTKPGPIAMKKLAACVAAAALMATWAAPASAVVCAKGVYRAGCAGPNGAAVARRPVAAPRCYYRAGVRVCR